MYVHLTDDELVCAKVKYGSGFQRKAHVLFEYGKSKEGYWTSEKFVRQMDHAVQIAEIKYRYPQISLDVAI